MKTGLAATNCQPHRRKNAEPPASSTQRGELLTVQSTHKPSVGICQAPNMEIVTSKDRLFEVIAAIQQTAMPHALDFETTSLRPETGVVRITSIYGPAGYFVIDHFKSEPFSRCAADIANAAAYAVFNRGFEQKWFDAHAYGLGQLYDIQYLRKAKYGGAPAGTLAAQAKTDLDILLVKEEQNSDWGRPELTPAQYAYAGRDAEVTYKDFVRWVEELTPQQWGGYTVMNDAVPAVMECEATGIPLDSKYHRKLVDLWTRKRDVAERYLRRFATREHIANLNSRQQIGAFLKEHVLTEQDYQNWPKTEKAKQMDLSRDILRQTSYRSQYPVSRWLAALMVYNYYMKLLSTYGDTLLNEQYKYGKVKYRLNIAAAITGRMSSSSINIQNIPKSPVIRRSFVADPAFPTGGVGAKHCLVMADYSSVEVRVLAAISGDVALMHECIYGDVHSSSAADRLRVPSTEFIAIYKDKKHPLQPQYKALRGKAKAITFSVCYGSGISNLALGLKCTDEEAAKAMEGWALRYPKAFAFRQVMFEKLTNTGFLGMADGRSVFVFKSDRTLPKASNYGIQGSAASVMYRALYHTRLLLDDSGIACKMAATVFDEIILRSQIACSKKAAEILGVGMTQGWLDVFPGTDTTNLFDADIGFSWADKS